MTAGADSGATRDDERGLATRDDKRGLLLACALLAIAWALYAKLAVKDFSGPLVGPRDTAYFEYLSYHLRAHYTFGIPPQMGFQTDEVGYWQGTSIAYLSWCAERDLFSMTMLRAFGIGPWLQIYCALSPGIGAFGTLFLLRKELGITRATLIAFAGSFMAFYASYKFPYHLNMSALHWGTISIAADYLIGRRVVRDKPIEAWLLLLRAALMVLTVGLDVGYVAGYPLTFFTVFVLFWLLRWAFVARKKGVRFRDYFPRTPLSDLKKTPLVTGLALLGLAIGLVFYVPFDLALVKGATVYQFPDAGGNFWASWPRMLLPFLPGANPSSPWVFGIFGDAEGVAEYSVGWALLAFFCIGIFHARRRKEPRLRPAARDRILALLRFPSRQAPHVASLSVVLLQSRVGARDGLLPARVRAVRRRDRHGANQEGCAYILFALGAVETVTAYTLVNDYTPARLGPDAWAYWDAVKKTPGEALLEWPFCVAGANGVGTTELCPYYGVMATAYSHRRFHEKKVMSFYLSRLHPSQVAPRYELAKLFSPDKPDPHDARMETRCFDDERWALFDRVYREHDFGAIQLYTDRLPAECVKQFHERYGEPVASANLPGPGHVELLPKKR